MTLRRGWRLALAVAVTGVFVWLLAREFRWSEVRALYLGVSWFWLALAVASVAAGYAARIARWCRLLRPLQSALRWRDCAGPLLAGFAVNNLLPLRAGDVLRAAAFSERLGVTVGVTTASLVIERVLDAAMLLVVLALAIWWWSVPSALEIFEIRTAGSSLDLAWMILALMPLIAIGLLWLWLRSARLRAEVASALAAVREAGQTLPMLAGWTILVWCCEGAAFWFAALALDGIVRPEAGWLAMPVATLATLLPGTPGHIGTFDYFAAEAMQWLGNGVSASLAFALLIHAVLWLPVTVAGGFWLWVRRA